MLWRTRLLLLCSGFDLMDALWGAPGCWQVSATWSPGKRKRKKKRAVTERGNSPIVKCCCRVCLEVVIFVLVSLKAAGSLFGFPEAFSHQLLSSCSHKGKVTKHAPLHPKSINPISQKCQPTGQAKPMPRYPGYNSEGRKLVKKRKMFLF